MTSKVIPEYREYLSVGSIFNLGSKLLSLFACQSTCEYVGTSKLFRHVLHCTKNNEFPIVIKQFLFVYYDGC